jgi:GH24 family phage-related lysozyme (muramidase)
MAEEHKQDLLIPNLASSLARIQNRIQKPEDIDLSEFKSQWDNFTSSLSRSEQIKVIDATLGILNFDSSENELDVGIAFLENMRDAGVAIGTTRLDTESGTPLGESFYEMKLDDLEEMREAVILKERKQADIRVRVKGDEYTDRYRKLSKAGYSESSEEIADDIQKEQQKIESLEGLSPYEKSRLLDQVPKSVKEGFSAESDIIDALEIESGRSNASPQAMLSETRRMLVTYVQKDLEGQKYKGVDVSEALIGERVPASLVGDPSAGDRFETFALGPELQNILSEKNQQFLTERAEAMELVARLDPGEEITLGDKVYTIEAGENIERKRNTIIAEHMTKRMGVIMASSKDAVDDLLASAVKKTEEETKVKDEEKARLDKIEEDKGIVARIREEVGFGIIKMSRKGEPTYGLKGTEAGEGIADIADMATSISGSLQYQAHSPEETKQIVEAFRKEAKASFPAYKRAFKFQSESRARSAQKNEAIRNLTIDYLSVKRLTGYPYEDVKAALSVKPGSPGYFPEGARIANPKEFFKNELLGKDGKTMATSFVTEMTAEQREEIAGLLEVSPEVLKEKQKEYLLYLSGERKATPEPTEVPEETPEEEPVKPPVTEAAKPKARPPIPEGPSFENYKRRRGSRVEQLELPLDNAKPAVGSVDKATTDMIKQFEGEFQPKAFFDVKQYSIGFGTKAKKGQTMTLAQAEKALAKELAGHAKKVDSYDKVYNWTPNERAAMISFAFNLGNTGFDKLTNNGKRTKQEIAEKMLEYNNKRVDGKLQFSKGLDNRRKAEREKFLTK